MPRPPHAQIDCPHAKNFCRRLEGLPGHRGHRANFESFLETAFVALHDGALRSAGRPCGDTAERWRRIAAETDRQTLDAYARMLADLALSLERHPRDVLGELFGVLDVGHAAAGQFYTPFAVSTAIARMSLPDPARTVAEQGVMTVLEPAVGAGGMLIAVRNLLIASGVDPRARCFTAGVDVDRRAVAMSYIQTALLGLPSVLLHGDSLAMTFHASYPNLHAMGFVARGYDAEAMLRRALAGAPD